jgi:O-antigen/teichoic acid export membrane protein
MNILRQTFLTFCGQSGGYVMVIFTGIVVARTLGPAGKGVIALAMLLLAIFTTYADGIQSAIMYQCGNRRDSENLVYAAALRLIGAVFLPLSIVLLVVGLAVPRWGALIFVAIAIPFSVYVQVASSFFLMRNQIGTTIVLAGFCTFGYSLVVVPALIVWHADADAVLGMWAAMYLFAAAYAWVKMEALIPTSAARRTTLPILFEQIRFGFKSGSISVATFLNLRVDVFIVGLMLNARTLGIYSLAVATAEMLWQLSRPLAWSTIGRIAVSDRSIAIELTASVTRNTLAVVGLAGAVLFAIAPVAIAFVCGSAYAQSGEVLRWLIPGAVCYSAIGTIGYYISIREGKPLTIFWQQTASVVACAAIAASTLHVLGIYGAALATSLTYAFSAIVRGFIFARTTGASPLSFTVLRSEDFRRFRRVAGRLFGSRMMWKRGARYTA